MREEEDAKEEHHSRHHLYTPRYAKGSGRLERVVGAGAGGLNCCVLNEVLDQDAPGNRPLLKTKRGIRQHLGRE